MSEMVTIPRAVVERALEALDDMIHRVEFACGVSAHAASTQARIAEQALRAALDAQQLAGTKFTPIEDCCDHMPIEEFLDFVSCGSIASDDGIGYYATKTHESNVDCFTQPAPAWATHVTWYNK